MRSKEFQYQAHYLNLLNILGESYATWNQINETKPQEPAIEVDLILDG